mgnify:CR=1 FL=1
MTNKALLKWQMEMGADEAVGDTPRNYFAAPKIMETSFRQQPESSATKEMDSDFRRNDSAKMQASPALGHASARALANNATTLAELESAVRAFDGCALKRTAQRTVFSDGNPAAKIMIIGEAPGADEDVQGIPFCGVSGKLLDKMLAAIGLDRTSVYITNTVFWRPPGNRQPSVEETSICLPFVERHIALVAPQLLLLAGGTATNALLKRDESMSRLRGKTYQYQNGYLQSPIQTMVTYHPSYLLRQPSQKRAAWQDMLMVQSVIN